MVLLPALTVHRLREAGFGKAPAFRHFIYVYASTMRVLSHLAELILWAEISQFFSNKLC
jgi:hypothetical protein